MCGAAEEETGVVVLLLVPNERVRKVEILDSEEIKLEQYGGGGSDEVTVLTLKGPMIIALEAPTVLLELMMMGDDDDERELVLIALLFWLRMELQ